MTKLPAIATALVSCVASACGASSAGDPDDVADAALGGGVADAAVDLTRKRVFVTSTVSDADLRTAGGGIDGLDGADRLCAAAANRGALGGEWRAWISTGTAAAQTRVLERGGAWYLVDRSTEVFRRYDSKIVIGPMHEIDVDETGARLASTEPVVWTGTTYRGGPAEPSCLDWTSADENSLGVFGYFTNLGVTWTTHPYPGRCSKTAALYCFEI